MATPILDLDTLTDRPTVVINQKEYWLRTMDVLPPLDGHQVQRMSARIGVLLQKATLSKAEETELKAIPNRLARILLEAPEAVHEKLDDAQRMLIAETAVTTFRSGLRIFPPPAGPAPAADPSTGETSSPASPGSTGATP